MVFIPHTDAERQAMLDKIGVSSLDALFADIPSEFRYPALGIGDGLSELEITHELTQLADKNINCQRTPTFLGAGAYRHWVPAVVDYVISRGEFATAYTPYQAEMSQGTLQAIFEYQSMICDLTGMEVANASHYDGATATAEAVIHAYNIFRKKRSKILLSPTLHPHYRETVRTYTQGMTLEISGDESLNNDVDSLIKNIDDNTACVIIQTPDFLGRIVNLNGLAERIRAKDKDTLLVVITNPISLGLFTPPGEFDADIVAGEGQPLGLGLNYGGPYLGFYATKQTHMRQIAGRLVGETVDIDGKKGYVLTLTTREQHIRREKATSNICTNQGLMTLAATVYMAALGKSGLRKVAELNYHKAHYAADTINALEHYSVWQDSPFFNEFVVQCPASVAEVNNYLQENGIVGGYDLSQDYPELNNSMLLAVTEVNTREEIDLLARTLDAFARQTGGAQ